MSVCKKLSNSSQTKAPVAESSCGQSNKKNRVRKRKSSKREDWSEQGTTSYNLSLTVCGKFLIAQGSSFERKNHSGLNINGFDISL